MKAVPIIQAVGTWKEKSSVFWVVGSNRKVYAPDFDNSFHFDCCIMLPICFRTMDLLFFLFHEKKLKKEYHMGSKMLNRMV